MSKIQEREYVKKEDVEGKECETKEYFLRDKILTVNNITKKFGGEKNKLVIQNKGIMVIEFLLEHLNIYLSIHSRKIWKIVWT